MDSSAKAVIFPGQGAQYVGMGRSLYETFSASRDLFSGIDEILGFQLSQKCFQGPEEDLKNTRYQQLAILAVSLAAFQALSEKDREKVKFLSGLSLGEYSCLYAAGVLSLRDVVLLVKERAEAMEEAATQNPSTMLALVGINSEAAQDLQSVGFYVANVNSPQQTVVSVAKGKKEQVIKDIAGQGIKVVELSVSGGFHSPFMEPARIRLEKIINTLEFSRARIPVVSNVTALGHTDPEEIRKNLLKQLVSPVLWKQCVEYMLAQGVGVFYETGPSRILKGLIRKISRQAIVQNFEKAEDFQDADQSVRK